MSLHEKVKEYIVQTFAPDISENELPSDLNLQATGIVTSVGIVQIMGWCGKTFQIPINQLQIDPNDFISVNKIVDFIIRYSDNLEKG